MPGDEGGTGELGAALVAVAVLRRTAPLLERAEVDNSIRTLGKSDPYRSSI